MQLSPALVKLEMQPEQGFYAFAQFITP